MEARKELTDSELLRLRGGVLLMVWDEPEQKPKLRVFACATVSNEKDRIRTYEKNKTKETGKKVYGWTFGRFPTSEELETT